MHIVDGAVSTPILAGGALLTAAGIAFGLKKLDHDKVPAAGVLAASFFVASLVHVPVGPTSVHLIANGLAGLVLGWAAFPALFVGLFLQAVFFGFGGLTVLGVNAFNIALPAVIVGAIFRPLILRSSPKTAAIWGGMAGGLSITLTALMVAATLALSGQAFFAAAWFVIPAHIPVMVIEAALSAAAVNLIVKVKPELLGYTVARPEKTTCQQTRISSEPASPTTPHQEATL